MIRVLLVDDEPLARDVIRFFLSDEPAVRIVSECETGREAVAAIHKLEPDLVFLDVQMPDWSGLDVLAQVGPEQMPAVIFVTAFDEHAVQAFDFHAVDYLLKPVEEERFRQALRRARERLDYHELRNAAGRLGRLLQTFGDQKPEAGTWSRGALLEGDRLVLRSRHKVSIVRLEELDWIESAGDYVYLHTERSKHLLRQTLARLESRLDRRIFRRIHRQTIVNLERIAELESTDHGEYRVILRDGTVLKLSRSYRQNLEDLLRPGASSSD